MKIEIGGQRNLKGWTEFNNRTQKFNIILDEVPVPDNCVEFFYMSHIIEHTPYISSHDIFKKLFDKLAPGGKLRILCPDLDEIIRTYNAGDPNNQFLKTGKPFGTVAGPYRDGGIGALLNAMFFNAKPIEMTGDTTLSTNDGRDICRVSHISCWNYDMLRHILSSCGYHRIEKTGFENIDPSHEPGQLCVNAFKPLERQ